MAIEFRGDGESERTTAWNHPVVRVDGHRFELHEIICSRCGVLMEDALVKPCLASTVDVIEKGDDGE